MGKYLVYRLYSEEGLSLKRSKPASKRKAASPRGERFKATAPNQAWSMDFVADQLQSGTRFRSLTIVDVFTREAVAIEPGQSMKGEDVVRTLNRLKLDRGVPKILFCDNVLTRERKAGGKKRFLSIPYGMEMTVTPSGFHMQGRSDRP